FQDLAPHALFGEGGDVPAAGNAAVPDRPGDPLAAAEEAAMIHWAAPQYLMLLIAVPIMAAAMLVGGWLKRRNLRRLADPELVPRLTESVSPRLAAVRAVCLLLGLVLLIVAAARPQWGEKLQVYKGRGIDIVIALDASKSMLAA